MIKAKINNFFANPYVGFALYFIFHSIVFGQFNYEISGNPQHQTFSKSISLGFFLAPLYSAIVAGILFRKRKSSNFENGQILINACALSVLAFFANVAVVYMLTGQFVIPSLMYTLTYAVLAPFAVMAGLSIGSWCANEKS